MYHIKSPGNGSLKRGSGDYSGTPLNGHPMNGGQPLYNGHLIKSQIQLPIPMCIITP